MTKVFPSSSNTFVPSLDATDALTIGFTRNVNDFSVNRYTQLKPVSKEIGYYTEINAEEAARLVSSVLNDMVWHDGNDAPVGNENKEKFEFLQYRTKRYAKAYRFGYKAVGQAAFDVLMLHAKIYAQMMMTARTQLAITAMQDHTATGVNTSAIVGGSISGTTGKWDLSTTSRNDIQRSIEHAVDTIFQVTLGVVKQSDLMLVMSPTTARSISPTQEIRDHIKGSPDALSSIRGEMQLARFGLPDRLFGLPVVIEDAVKVTNRKGATVARSYVADADKPFICARPGSLVAPDIAGPSYSSCTLFALEDMTVETKDDPDNRRHQGRITTDITAVRTAPSTLFIFQDALT